MASLLIIGGSGFFGKSFLDAYRRGLLNEWNVSNIIVLARHATDLLDEHPELINSSVELINADISNCQEIPHADFVIHAAASTDARNYLNRPQEEKRNIQSGTYNYCKLATQFHILSKILYCSSGAVYGQQPNEIECLMEEVARFSMAAMSPIKKDYAAAKIDAENAIIALGENGGSVSIARCFAFIGKYLPRDKHFAIGNFIEDGIKGGPISIKSTHPVFRSYMHADDLVCWLMTICANAKPSCPIYNVGSDEAVSIEDLADIIASQFNIKVSKSEISPFPIDRYIPSISKARGELGLDLKYSLEQSLKNIIASIQLKDAHD